MKTNIQNAITLSISTQFDLNKVLSAELKVMSKPERIEFQLEAYELVAKLYSVSTKSGQRGMTFCALNKKGEEIEATPAVISARMWWSRNIAPFFKTETKAAAAPSAMWKRIASEITLISRKAKKLDAKVQREFFARLAELEAEFFSE